MAWRILNEAKIVKDTVTGDVGILTDCSCGEVKTLAHTDNISFLTNGVIDSRIDAMDEQTTESVLMNSYPGKAHIKGIYGASEQKQYTGKNLFDVSKVADTTGLVNSDGVLTFTDTYTVITSAVLSELADLTVGETYTLSFKTTSPNNFIYLRGTETQWNNGESLTITQEMLDRAINLYGVNSGTSTISEIQIEQGTVATDYEQYVGGVTSPNPDYPQEIVSVGVSGTLEVKSCGKNLLKHTVVTQTINGITWTREENGSFVANGTATADSTLYLRSSNDSLIKVPSSKHSLIYSGVKGGSISTYRMYTWKTGWIPYAIVTDGEVVVNKGTEDIELTIGLQVRSGVTVNNVIFEPMIRLAEVEDATYEPYKESVTYIPLTEPLRSVGDVKDEIVCVDGVYGVTRRIGSIVIDGDENLNLSTINDYGICNFYLYDATNFKAKNYNAICNRFTLDTTSIVNVTKECFTLNTLGYLYFRIKSERLSTVDEFKAWAADNPIEVYYILATETFTPFDDQRLFYSVKTFSDVTHVKISGNASADIEYGVTENGARAIDDKLTIKGNEARIKALENAVLSLGGNV